MAELCTVALRRGDTLENLAARYGVTPQQITSWNDIPWDGASINAWVLATGGVRLPLVPSSPNPFEPGKGWPVFSDSSRILLPPGGPRACVSSSSTGKTGGAGLLVALGLALFAFSE